MRGFYLGASELLTKSPSSLYSKHELEAERLLCIGDDHYNVNDFENSIITYRKALFLSKHTQTRAAIHNSIGYSFYRLKDYDQAIINFHKSVEHEPNFGYAYDNLTLCLIRKNDIDKATQYIHIGMETNFYDPGYYHRNLALLHWSKNETDKAEVEFSLAFQKANDFVDQLEVDYCRFLTSIEKNEAVRVLLQPALERNEPEAIKYMNELYGS